MTTFLESFVRLPQICLAKCKAARLSKCRTVNFQHVYFPCDFPAMYRGRKTAARQPQVARTIALNHRPRAYAYKLIFCNGNR